MNYYEILLSLSSSVSPSQELEVQIMRTKDMNNILASVFFIFPEFWVLLCVCAFFMPSKGTDLRNVLIYSTWRPLGVIQDCRSFTFMRG